MHIIEPQSYIPEGTILNWWSLKAEQLEQFARGLVGAIPNGWVRQGKNFIEICGEYGSDARKIPQEMKRLAQATQQIRVAGGPDIQLRAAAFYHLRFQRIHPLVEGNGRVGRFILAQQLDQECGIPINETLTGLKDWELDYNRVFVSQDSAIRFELFMELLARITATTLAPDSLKLPASLNPAFPQKGRPKLNNERVLPETQIQR